MSYFKYSFQKRLFCTAAAPSKNPRVFFSISSNGENLGKMTFELYSDRCPKTAENFKALCSGENTEKLTYKGNIFHRVIPQFMAQGGDITKQNGTGGKSIYGRTFPDENLKLKHSKRGILAMANAGPDSNGSQFFITFAATPWLDGYHCVFGEMIEGEDVLKKIEEVGNREGKTKKVIKIEDCGLVKH